MDDKKKDGYIVSGGFFVIGLIFIFTNGWKFDIPFFIGVGCSLLGIAGFRWPNIAEVLVHWMKKHKNVDNSTRQIQKDVKNSNQVSAGGDVKIIQNFLPPKEKDVPKIDYQIASVLPETVRWNFIKDWKVWFGIFNHDSKEYLVYVNTTFIIEDKEEIIVLDGYYGGTKSWKLHALGGYKAPGLTIPDEVKKATKEKKRIEIQVKCEIRDEKNKLLHKTLPLGWVYHHDSDSWYAEYSDAAAILQAINGQPAKLRIFLCGMPFEPPRAGIRARMSIMIEPWMVDSGHGRFYHAVQPPSTTTLLPVM